MKVSSLELYRRSKRYLSGRGSRIAIEGQRGSKPDPWGTLRIDPGAGRARLNRGQPYS